MALTYLFFISLAVLIVTSAVAVVLVRHALYSALFLVANFSFVALLYVGLGAPFIAMAQISVYAGAIMVLFLFVIMLLGTELLPQTKNLPTQRFIAFGLGVIALIEIGLFVVWRWGDLVPMSEHAADYASPHDVGLLLFTKYALPFEVTSVILLVACIGAVVLTHGEGLNIRKRMLQMGKEE